MIEDCYFIVFLLQRAEKYTMSILIFSVCILFKLLSFNQKELPQLRVLKQCQKRGRRSGQIGDLKKLSPKFQANAVIGAEPFWIMLRILVSGDLVFWLVGF